LKSETQTNCSQPKVDKLLAIHARLASLVYLLSMESGGKPEKKKEKKKEEMPQHSLDLISRPPREVKK
tara:strand:+ start:1053 stop:1256 length:204 start_codon:yes stop_codon:yes gene_type:complete